MHPERDDAAYQLRREEVGELRGKRCNAGREVAAFVVCDAAGVDHSLDIRVTVVWIGDGGDSVPFFSNNSCLIFNNL